MLLLARPNVEMYMASLEYISSASCRLNLKIPFVPDVEASDRGNGGGLGRIDSLFLQWLELAGRCM